MGGHRAAFRLIEVSSLPMSSINHIIAADFNQDGRVLSELGYGRAL